MTMKRIVYCWLIASVMATVTVTVAGAQSQSLGDYARSVRKQKGQKAPDTKKFDDDSLPKTDTLSVVGPPPTQSSSDDSANGKPKSQNGDQPVQAGQDGKPDQKMAAQPAKDEAAQREKSNKEWEKKFADQKAQIDLLTRELDVVQREYRLRAAAMYADVGNRMRNSAEWDKEDTDYKQKIADKQKALDDAKQKLEDMKEQARKAGAPASVRE